MHTSIPTMIPYDRSLPAGQLVAMAACLLLALLPVNASAETVTKSIDSYVEACNDDANLCLPVKDAEIALYYYSDCPLIEGCTFPSQLEEEGRWRQLPANLVVDRDGKIQTEREFPLSSFCWSWHTWYPDAPTSPEPPAGALQETNPDGTITWTACEKPMRGCAMDQRQYPRICELRGELILDSRDGRVRVESAHFTAPDELDVHRAHLPGGFSEMRSWFSLSARSHETPAYAYAAAYRMRELLPEANTGIPEGKRVDIRYLPEPHIDMREVPRYEDGTVLIPSNHKEESFENYAYLIPHVLGQWLHDAAVGRLDLDCGQVSAAAPAVDYTTSVCALNEGLAHTIEYMVTERPITPATEYRFDIRDGQLLAADGSRIRDKTYLSIARSAAFFWDLVDASMEDDAYGFQYYQDHTTVPFHNILDAMYYGADMEGFFRQFAAKPDRVRSWFNYSAVRHLNFVNERHPASFTYNLYMSCYSHDCWEDESVVPDVRPDAYKEIYYRNGSLNDKDNKLIFYFGGLEPGIYQLAARYRAAYDGNPQLKITLNNETREYELNERFNWLDTEYAPVPVAEVFITEWDRGSLRVNVIDDSRNLKLVSTLIDFSLSRIENR